MGRLPSEILKLQHSMNDLFWRLSETLVMEATKERWLLDVMLTFKAFESASFICIICLHLSLPTCVFRTEDWKSCSIYLMFLRKLSITWLSSISQC